MLARLEAGCGGWVGYVLVGVHGVRRIRYPSVSVCQGSEETNCVAPHLREHKPRQATAPQNLGCAGCGTGGAGGVLLRPRAGVERTPVAAVGDGVLRALRARRAVARAPAALGFPRSHVRRAPHRALPHAHEELSLRVDGDRRVASRGQIALRKRLALRRSQTERKQGQHIWRDDEEQRFPTLASAGSHLVQPCCRSLPLAWLATRRPSWACPTCARATTRPRS